jgi:hypothetical protein
MIPVMASDKFTPSTPFAHTVDYYSTRVTRAIQDAATAHRLVHLHGEAQYLQDAKENAIEAAKLVFEQYPELRMK